MHETRVQGAISFPEQHPGVVSFRLFLHSKKIALITVEEGIGVGGTVYPSHKPGTPLPGAIGVQRIQCTLWSPNDQNRGPKVSQGCEHRGERTVVVKDTPRKLLRSPLENV